MSSSMSSYSGEFAGVEGSKELRTEDTEFKPEQVMHAHSTDNRACVLEVAVQVPGVYQPHAETAVVCPNCLDVVDTFDDTPSRLIRWTGECSDCETELMRHEALCVDTDLIDKLDAEMTTELIDNWFRVLQRTGPSRGAQKFRNWELQDRRNELAEKWDISKPSCPICDSNLGDTERLDTDHHDRMTDSVLLVCRDCHAHGHNVDKKGGMDSGSNSTAGDVQDAKAQRLGFRSGVDLKLWRYVKKYEDEHSEDELDYRYMMNDGKWQHLAERLNAYTWVHNSLEARAAELQAVCETIDDSYEDCWSELAQSNTNKRPSW